MRLNEKVLVIGLDGATLDLIDPLIAEGRLPNLSSMLSSGIHSKLRSTILPLSPTAWSTFSTGRNAGKHGIYDFQKRVRDSYKFAPTTSSDLKTNTIWDMIGEAGGQSIVINVPLTYPPTKVNGVMISGFPTPPGTDDFIYPKEALEDIKEKFGSIQKPLVLYRKGREEEIAKSVIDISRTQTAITKYFMKHIDWNLAVSVYDATDVIGHYFWAYLDINHPKYDPEIASTVRELVNDVHVELDSAIGELVEEAGPNALKLVVSDHGFGSIYYGVYVNNWLLEQKYMAFKRTVPVRARYWAFRHGLHTYNLLQLAKKLHFVKSVEAAYSTRSILLKLLRMTSLSMDDIDWERTSVYSAGNFGQLYLNLQGREPKGIVSQKDADKLVNELVGKISELEDPSTHRKMFDHVYPKLDAFNGPASASAPDIVFFDEEMMYAAHRMFELGSNKLVSPHPVYSGHHKMDGILFMSGKSAKFIQGFPRSEPRLTDLAPTILHYLNLPVPEDMDGRVLSEFFVDDSEFNLRDVTVSKSKSESEKIKVSLKKLRSAGSL
ncbi:MAG: alkaline phosphatase family protein [Nitrososphaerales archaeon]